MTAAVDLSPQNAEGEISVRSGATVDAWLRLPLSQASLRDAVPRSLKPWTQVHGCRHALAPRGDATLTAWQAGGLPFNAPHALKLS